MEQMAFGDLGMQKASGFTPNVSSAHANHGMQKASGFTPNVSSAHEGQKL